MRQAAKGCGSRASLLLAGVLLAAVGCEGDGAPTEPGQPTAPIGPNTDPMKIGQTDLPVPSKPVEISSMDGAEFPSPNATSFETAKAVEEASSGGNAKTGGPALRTASKGSVPAAGAAPPASPAASDGATLAPGAPGAQAPSNAAGNPAAMTPADPGVMREIVEADIVQAQGDILYLLNRYRGLVLVDMSNPDSPYVRGRVPFQAQPVDMYLRGGKALIVMSDYFSYWQFDSDADPLGFHGSQVLVVDVVDPSRPTVNGSFNVDGEVTDTRIVGDVLYAVSKRNPDYWRYDTQDWEDTTWVLSIDLSDPSRIHQVDKHEFPGAANLIQVYQTALTVAAIDPNYYLVDEDNVRQTKITHVDISDPKGVIRIGGSAYVPGAVEDKFKMDLSDGQLRVMSQNWYWNPQSSATLTILDTSDSTKLTQRAQIPVATDTGVGNYVQPQATRFSGKDFFVNLCWWGNTTGTQVCRVDFYDLSNPSAPAKVGSLDVDGAITHFEVRGQRLLSLGTHTDFNRGFVQIALFDISDTRAPRRLAAVDLGEQGGTGSAALQDYKAFKVLDELGMILLPLSWVEMPSPNQYFSKQGAQIVDWKNDTLVGRGRIAQGGYVERAIAFKNRVVSISTEQVQVIDATNRDLPVQTANLFLVRNVVDVFNIKGYQVQLGASESDNTYRFFVLPFGEDDMAKSLAELPVETGLMYQMRSGDLIYVIGSEPTTGGQEIRAADFSDPLHPRWRGQYRIADDIQHIYSGSYRGYWSFYDYYWNPAAGMPLGNNQLLPVTTRVVNTGNDGRRFYKNALRLIDLRDPDHLKLANGSLQMDDYPFINKVGHGTLLYSTHTEPALDANGNPKKYHERYFMDRVDGSDPNNLKALPKVNIPGRLVDVDAAGKLLYTVDYQWDEHGRRRNSFNVLRLDGDVATLTTVLPVGDEIDRARYLDREVWLSTHSYPWYGRSDDSADSRQPYTRLTRLRFDEQGAIANQGEHDVTGYHFDLLDVDGPRVYLASSYPTGLLILDTTDLANPTILGASRTVGYVSKLVREGDALYMPMGSYGVRRVSTKP